MPRPIPSPSPLPVSRVPGQGRGRQAGPPVHLGYCQGKAMTWCSRWRLRVGAAGRAWRADPGPGPSVYCPARRGAGELAFRRARSAAAREPPHARSIRRGRRPRGAEFKLPRRHASRSVHRALAQLGEKRLGPRRQGARHLDLDLNVKRAPAAAVDARGALALMVTMSPGWVPAGRSTSSSVSSSSRERDGGAERRVRKGDAGPRDEVDSVALETLVLPRAPRRRKDRPLRPPAGPGRP